jgi:hypothetical protein
MKEKFKKAIRKIIKICDESLKTNAETSPVAWHHIGLSDTYMIRNSLQDILNAETEKDKLEELRKLEVEAETKDGKKVFGWYVGYNRIIPTSGGYGSCFESKYYGKSLIGPVIEVDPDTIIIRK